MPTYEYLCTSCQNAWEEIQKISEKPTEVCPSCGKSTAKRQISGGNFILKGGGWYADLYSSSKPKADANGKAEPNGASETKPETKPETKTETKSETKPAASTAEGPSRNRSTAEGPSRNRSTGEGPSRNRSTAEGPSRNRSTAEGPSRKPSSGTKT